MAVINNKRILKCLLMMVVSLLLILNFSIGVSASSGYDRQEVDTCITISQRLSVKGGSNQLLLEKTPTRRELAEQKLAEAASGINNKTIDSRTNMEIGRFIGDDRGNVFIEPVGGTTVPAGRNGVDTHTLYPNGSNYNRYNPVGHGNNTTPHGHGHLMGTGPGRRGQGPSIDVLGNVVPFNSPDAHWTIH